MFDRQSGLPLVYLATSQCIVTNDDCVISTTLGSCVAVVLYSPRLSLGGICHAFLPRSDDYSMRPAQNFEPCRYADEAVRHLLNGFSKRGAMTGEISARMYGGASRMAMGAGTLPENQAIGPRNVEVAASELAKAGLFIEHKDVGGAVGRRLLFSPNRGLVRIQHLSPQGAYDPPATFRQTTE